MMMSSIKYVKDKDNEQKKLIKELINKFINEYEEKNNTHIIRPPFLYELVLYSKYIVENKDLDIKKIIDGNLKELIDYLKERFGKLSLISINYYIDSISINNILKKIIFDDYEISTYMDRVLDNYVDPKKKYLLISTHDIEHIKYSNIDVCINMHPKKIEQKKLMDEITNTRSRRYYRSIEDIESRRYDEIIIINDGKEYKDLNDIVPNLRYFKGNIIMKCKYVDVSNSNDITTIEEILFDKDKTYIKYNGLNNKGTLIKELSNMDDNSVKEIINTKEEIKDICISITKDDFKNHIYRIGFKTYNKKLDINKAKILRLIDHNKHLVKRLRELDGEIAREIDELIVR